MREYLLYKDWWMEWHADPLIPSLYWGYTREEAFKTHVSELGLYGLMEAISAWVSRK